MALLDGSRVLFIGNSYTGYHCSLPEYVRLACAAATPSIEVHCESVLLYANELSAVFTSTPAVDSIRTGTWDVVVLQGYNDPIIDHAAYAQAVTDFHQEITAVGGLTVLFMVWEMRMHENRWAINSIKGVTDSLGLALNIPVAPVGQLWMTIKYVPPRDLIPDPLAFLCQDDVHPTQMSAGMNALAKHRARVTANGRGFARIEKSHCESGLRVAVHRQPHRLMNPWLGDATCCPARPIGRALFVNMDCTRGAKGGRTGVGQGGTG